MENEKNKVTTMQMPTRRFLPLFAAMLALAVSPAFAVPEIELNDTFGTSQILAPGTTSVEGFLGPLPDIFVFDALTDGEVDTFSFGGLTSGDDFTAVTAGSDGNDTPDTTMGSFGPGFAGPPVTDDDGNIAGDELGSAIEGAVNADGTVNLKVSGFDDFDFDGLDDGSTDAHNESGDYGLSVYLDGPDLSELESNDDVDFFVFTGLLPGAAFTSEIIAAGFDTILGLFDDTGSIIDDDDDGGINLLSQLLGLVPASGTVNLAVSGFSDFNFDGDGHDDEYGYYFLSFDAPLADASGVPEPTTLLLLGLGLAGLGFARRRLH